MAVTREQVIEYLSALAPDRLHDLILELEDIWGIERPASGPPPFHTLGMIESEPEWDLILVEAGPQRETLNANAGT